MARTRQGGTRVGKSVSIGPLIKQQLNGRKHKVVDIDTEDQMTLIGLQRDIETNPERYSTVNILGVDIIVRLDDGQDD